MVLTGASSGIGRAAALLFAAREARLVLAARGAAALEEVAAECRARGAAAEAVPTDVSDENAVGELARAAVARMGGFDVWVNDAGIAAFGSFLDVPAPAFRRVLETNFFGMVHGSRVALRQFQRQGGGVLINVASVLGQEGVPFLSAYVSSKEAVIGLSSCLREELRGHGIEICTILPAAIDTPIWQHAANYTGRAVQPLPPIYYPESVARAIVRRAQRPRPMTYVGWGGHAVSLFHKAMPSGFEHLARPITQAFLFVRGKRAAVPSDGNLFSPSAPPHGPHGGWAPLRRRRMLAGAAVLALPLAAGALAWSVWRRRRGARAPVRRAA